MGLYSVMAYSVAQRTSEIGIRVALGAQPLNAVAVVLRQGMGLAVARLCVGMLASAAMARVASAMFTTLRPTDPPVYLALASMAIPAWRALRVDPMAALRSP
jgi:ABC-type antimicrobial peptide transport system permease subunit